MRRLAFAAALAVAAPSAVRAEPLDVDLARLGAPDPAVWATILTAQGSSVDPAVLARESRQRFAVLSSELALALSTAILHPASTMGHSGFDVDLEIATAKVDAGALGSVPPGGNTNRIWPTRSAEPGQLYLPSVHFRKALPFSLEFGGRMIYVAQTSYYAGQVEAKWAINEGFEHLPDVAVRAAYTRLFGQKDWNLGTTDLDLMVSKRFGLNAVTSLTPYLAGRLSWVNASSERIDFAPRSSTGATDVSTDASFPRFTAAFYRTTLGVRFTAHAVSLALEGTYFGGSSPSSDSYGDLSVASSFGAAARIGWEF